VIHWRRVHHYSRSSQMMASLNGDRPPTTTNTTTTPHSSKTTITTITSPHPLISNTTQPPSLSETDGTSPMTKEKSSQEHTASTPLTNGNPTPPLNPRSCTTCRKRKVRCDKRHPCANCTKANIVCLFPGPGRAPRRSRKPPDTELLARLRRLEGVVQSLGKGIEDEGGGGGGVIEAGIEVESPKPTGKDDGSKRGCALHHDGGLFGLHSANREMEQSENMVKEFGRLSVEGGRSRYVSNKFWVSLSEEVRDSW
jgi:hypothetical protein